MKAIFTAIIALCFLSVSAVAGNNNGPKFGGDANAKAVSASSSKAVSKSSATGVGVGVGVSGAKSNSGGNTQNVSVTNQGDDFPASSAIAPGLVANGCMGSSALAGQGMSFGLSLGTTWTDEDCLRIRKAMDMQRAGFKKAALAIRCTDPDVRAAMQFEDVKCPQDAAQAAQETAQADIGASAAPAADPVPSGYNPSDRGCLVNRALAERMGADC